MVGQDDPSRPRRGRPPNDAPAPPTGPTRSWPRWWTRPSTGSPNRASPGSPCARWRRPPGSTPGSSIATSAPRRTWCARRWPPPAPTSIASSAGTRPGVDRRCCGGSPGRPVGGRGRGPLRAVAGPPGPRGPRPRRPRPGLGPVGPDGRPGPRRRGARRSGGPPAGHQPGRPGPGLAPVRAGGDGHDRPPGRRGRRRVGRSAPGPRRPGGPFVTLDQTRTPSPRGRPPKDQRAPPRPRGGAPGRGGGGRRPVRPTGPGRGVDPRGGRPGRGEPGRWSTATSGERRSCCGPCWRAARPAAHRPARLHRAGHPAAARGADDHAGHLPAHRGPPGDGGPRHPRVPVRVPGDGPHHRRDPAHPRGGRGHRPPTGGADPRPRHGRAAAHAGAAAAPPGSSPTTPRTCAPAVPRGQPAPQRSAGCQRRSAAGHVRPGHVLVGAGLAGQAEDPLAEDVALDLGRAALDRVGPGPQEHLAGRPGRADQAERARTGASCSRSRPAPSAPSRSTHSS